ncbi:MAG: hypothetical protein JWN70_3268 [Planctomycetaceae bacterium]|nr:hypothetical protein [Planctomycetaceae bacterium]
MPRPQTSVCTDCGGAMHEIKLIDKVHNYATREFEYAALDARPSFWTGALPLAGTVRAYMCCGCSLIKTYGSPGSYPSDLTSRPTE